MTVGSIVAKDGIGCVKYVSQSLNNDKIPEKQRNFVAALDLTNGILMILAQIGMFALMRKYSGPIFDKIFKKSFNPKTAMHSHKYPLGHYITAKKFCTPYLPMFLF